MKLDDNDCQQFMSTCGSSNPFPSAYNETKAAVPAYSHTPGLELAPLCIKVETLHMGVLSNRHLQPEFSQFNPESLRIDAETGVK
jgi:NAD(P)-dependent dehydrogenase (short-subunit alcohol dehydrogenase family)